MYVPHERRALILRLLEQRGYVRTGALAQELGVTEETIRTDLIAMHASKLLCRVHGGAKYTPPTGGEEDGARLDCQLIARLLPHLERGERLYLDDGLLAYALLPHLAKLECSIATASPRLALAAAAPALKLRVTMPAGRLDTKSQWIAPLHEADRAAFLSGINTALLFPPALPAPDCVAYPHDACAAWAAASARAAARTIITTSAHAFYTTAEHTAACSPLLLISEDNLPPGFETLPTELVPYLSPADLRWGEEETFA